MVTKMLANLWDVNMQQQQKSVPKKNVRFMFYKWSKKRLKETNKISNLFFLLLLFLSVSEMDVVGSCDRRLPLEIERIRRRDFFVFGKSWVKIHAWNVLASTSLDCQKSDWLICYQFLKINLRFINRSLSGSTKINRFSPIINRLHLRQTKWQ